MIVLGVDPGTHITGWGLVGLVAGQRPAHIAHGIVRTRAEDPLWVRLAAIHDALVVVLEQHRPNVLALEQCFVNKNIQSALKLGHARGAVMVAAHRFGLDVFEYGPTQVKSAVAGSGRADKHQVAEMVRLLLGLPTSASADASDALAIAICHSHNGLARAMAREVVQVRR